MKFNIFVNGTLGWYDGTRAVLSVFDIWTGSEGWEAKADALTYEHIYDAARAIARDQGQIVEIRDADYVTPYVLARFNVDGTHMPLNYYVYTSVEQGWDGRVAYVIALTDHYTTHGQSLSQFQHDIAGPLPRTDADAEVARRSQQMVEYGLNHVTRQIFDFIQPVPVRGDETEWIVSREDETRRVNAGTL